MASGPGDSAASCAQDAPALGANHVPPAEPDTATATPPCECTGRQRAFGHHYTCVYGPLRDLPGLRLRSAYPADFPMTSLHVVWRKTKTGWRLLRVLR